MRDWTETNKAVAKIAAVRGRADAPRRTGRLAASVRPGATRIAAIERAGNTSVPYAGPIHWGWPKRHIKPNPFMSRAAHETQPEWIDIYFAKLNEMIDKIKGDPNGGNQSA